ncbi:MAG: KUP/HAK/KT family potassium transporter [Bacteroidetes bacterium]|nr:KUP/HAK/KT family potassium transporter [Bacteroidota bacterium]
MSKDDHLNLHKKVTFAGLLVTLGIIYGDIGTSPLYVLQTIVGTDNKIDGEIIFGALSCIVWTLTLQTTIKYVLLTLRADNNGEGGIFALYALVRRTKRKWLLLPAIIGGSMLLADGIITPPISVTAAVEGVSGVSKNFPIASVTIGILAALFIIQQFGTKFVGKFFGPMMFVWFSMLAVLGISQIKNDYTILNALNPYYAIHLLLTHKGMALGILGAVFLCTTGAEALYSDLGHCGRKNIRITWTCVKICLVLNYFGQGAWLISHEGHKLSEFADRANNPFYTIMPDWFYGAGIVIATAAAIIASQALITGSFTLINEAIRLNFWPKVRIKYPTNLKGQLYIPSVNWLLLIGCIGIVIFFHQWPASYPGEPDSSKMGAAYGLAIIVTMLMTTILLSYYLLMKRTKVWLVVLVLIVYLPIELLFLRANLEKFRHGGFITVMVGILLIALMWIWYDARKIRNRYVEFVKLDEYLPMVAELGQDTSIPKYATHLVYLTSADIKDEIESKIIYSILQKRPKRADVYWFVHVHGTDSPYTMEYKVNELVAKEVFRIDFFLGFRVPTKINLLFRKVVQEMVTNHEVDITSRYESLNKANVIGDFRFVVLEKYLSADNELPVYEKIILDIYYFMKPITLSEESAFGLDTSSVTVEKVPIVIAPGKEFNMRRIS